MNNEDIKLLEDNGWVVECENPFEISTDDCGFASGEAAHMILNTLKHDARYIFIEKDMHDCFNAGINRGITIACIITKHDIDTNYPNYDEYMKKYDEDK